MSRILTGIQASGRPHLGNILGAIEPAIKLSKEAKNESFLFIADLHTLTSLKDPQKLIENTHAIAAAWLAFGFDTDKNYFYRQSRLAAYHTELMWYLNCFTPYPMLANAHSFKDKSDKLSDVNAGLFTYPVLQAADILLYHAHFVPVGKDQKQHIEMTRDMATAFNNCYKSEILTLPKSIIDEAVMTIPGIDGQKMSKSLNNYIDVFLGEKELKKAIMSIVTDSLSVEDKKNPDTCNVFALYSLVADADDSAKMRNLYLEGGYGYGHAKTALFNLLFLKYAKEREIFNYYLANIPELEAKLKIGEAKAQFIANDTINKVRAVIGF
jgi:tryptophanyl-tRNA synthetase